MIPPNSSFSPPIPSNCIPRCRQLGSRRLNSTINGAFKGLHSEGHSWPSGEVTGLQCIGARVRTPAPTLFYLFFFRII